MSKISFETYWERTIIINRLSYPEAVNERIYNDILSGAFEGLLPISVQQWRKETRVECVVQGLIPFDQYFRGVITKQRFLDFAHQIAAVIKNCEKNRVSANNLDLQENMIFIDPKTNQVKCVFWPVVNNQRGRPPHQFLKQLPYGLLFHPAEDNRYLDTYISFFSDLTPFSVKSFDKMVMTLSGKHGEEEHRLPSERRADGVKSQENRTGKSAIEYDPFAEDVVEEEPVKEPAEEPIADDIVSADEETMGLSVAPLRAERLVYPELIRERTGESHTINKPAFRVGADARYCDLLISDNAYVSRRHAELITRGGKYYIVDLHSKNRTYVNDVAIPEETEVEICSNTKIRLANEMFTFYIPEDAK